MDAAAGLLLMLLGVSHGVETFCDGRQDGAQCYGALGGTVDIQLMNSTSAPRFQLLNTSSKILDVKNNTVIANLIEHRSLYLSNGTFRINNLSSIDSGNYSFKTYDSDGKCSNEWTLHLFIQAPVSSVLLLSECLSQGEMRVSCSSEGGDSPQYSWTLDGRTLTDAELLSEANEGNNITLKQHVSGHLVCSVRNNVSKVSKEERISTCGFIFINCTSVNGTQISGWVHEDNNTLCTELTTQTAVSKESVIVSNQSSTNITLFNQAVSNDCLLYIMISGVLSALVIFLVVGVAVICAQRKKENNKSTKQEDECDEEVTYADVRVMKRQMKKVEQRTELEAEAEAEVEVEYGQVKFLASAD